VLCDLLALAVASGEHAPGLAPVHQVDPHLGGDSRRSARTCGHVAPRPPAARAPHDRLQADARYGAAEHTRQESQALSLRLRVAFGSGIGRASRDRRGATSMFVPAPDAAVDVISRPRDLDRLETAHGTLHRRTGHRSGHCPPARAAPRAHHANTRDTSGATLDSGDSQPAVEPHAGGGDVLVEPVELLLGTGKPAQQRARASAPPRVASPSASGGTYRGCERPLAGSDGRLSRRGAEPARGLRGRRRRAPAAQPVRDPDGAEPSRPRGARDDRARGGADEVLGSWRMSIRSASSSPAEVTPHHPRFAEDPSTTQHETSGRKAWREASDGPSRTWNSVRLYDDCQRAGRPRSAPDRALARGDGPVAYGPSRSAPASAPPMLSQVRARRDEADAAGRRPDRRGLELRLSAAASAWTRTARSRSSGARRRRKGPRPGAGTATRS